MTNRELGGNIRKIRELKGFSQQSLADEIDVDQKTISRIENGTLSPKFDLLIEITKTLNINLHQLLSFNEELIFNNYTQHQPGEHLAPTNTSTVEQIETLYRDLLNAKDKIIELLNKKNS